VGQLTCSPEKNEILKGEAVRVTGAALGVEEARPGLRSNLRFGQAKQPGDIAGAIRFHELQNVRNYLRMSLPSPASATLLGLFLLFLLFVQFLASPFGRLLLRRAGPLLRQTGLQRIHQVDDLGLGRGSLRGDFLPLDLTLDGLEYPFTYRVVIILGSELVV